MTSLSQNISSARAALPGLDSDAPSAAATPACPACLKISLNAATERYGKYELFDCAACGLQFWEPRAMPDASWYEQMYGGRDEKLLPLEPGHRYFLTDELAPRRGDLLDIGCGTGNFLAAARNAGYSVSGTELDRNAAQFAKEKLGLPRVHGLTVSEFAKQHPVEKFDVVSFFEVLEHQTAPAEFLENVKSLLRPRGYIALSVPNRERWLTGPDVLDYPPNHFLRWNATALRSFLNAHGFETLSVKEQPADIRHTAQMINMGLRTGLTGKAAGNAVASFRDVMQMPVAEAAAALQAKPTARQRAVQFLGRLKHAACYPMAIAAYPYIRMRGYKGTYLYFLARLLE